MHEFQGDFSTIDHTAKHRRSEIEPNESEEWNMEIINNLQMGWFIHRCQALKNEKTLAAKLQQLAREKPSLTDQIARSSLEEQES